MHDDETTRAIDEAATIAAGAIVSTFAALAILFSLASAVAIGCSQSATAQADDVAGERRDEVAALLLARTCVSERGWRTETTDCRAIAEVARHRVDARGVSLEVAIRQLSPRLHIEGVVARPWILDLADAGNRPDGLRTTWTEPRCAVRRIAGHCPDDSVLPSRRDAWLATLDEARRIVAGELPSPCAERPSRWGSRADVARGRRSGHVWVPVDCGETRNRFGHWR